MYNRIDRISTNFILGEYFENDESWRYFLSLKKSDQDVIYANILAHVKKLQLFRNWLKKPIHITSGFRSPLTNKNDGGEKNSYHLKAMAADIWYLGIEKSYRNDFVQLCAVFNGVLYYSNKKFFHTDIRSATKKYQDLYWR